METNKKLHWSAYNIYNEVDDQVCILQGYTGALNCIDKLKFEFIKENNFTEEKANKFLGADAVKKLMDRGFLTTLSKEEEHRNVVTLGNVIDRHEKNSFVITLVVTYYCNFRCPYCFENVANKGIESMKNTVITKEVVDNVFKFVDKQTAEGKKFGNLTLFGGEPLLKENREIVEYIVKKAHNYDVKVHAITNGYDLDYYFDLIEEGYINRLKITLDGVGEVHSCRRRHETDPDSFSKIVANVDYLLENTNVNVSISGNINIDNFNDLIKLIDFYSEKGWIDNNNFDYHFKSLHACYEKDETKKINDYILGNMVDEDIRYEHIAAYLRMKKRFEEPIKNGGMPHLSSAYCKASGEMYVTDWEGNIYPCWERVGEKENIIGRIAEDGVFIENPKFSYWKNRKSHKMSICSNCPYVFICCGYCPSHAHVSFGDIYRNNCSDNKKLINDCIAKTVKEMLDND